MKFKHGLELIKQIGIERAKIIKAKNDYEQAEAALLEINKISVMNQAFEKKKVQQQEIIEEARSKASDCYQELIDLKEEISPQDWHYLLEYLGLTLAKIDYLTHIEDCLDSPSKLKGAITDAIVMLKRKAKRREQAIMKNDEDRIVILSAEITFYENDLKKHPLGVAYLEEYYAQEKEKRSSHDRKK